MAPFSPASERSWPAVFDTLSLLSIIDPVTFESAGPTKPTGSGPFTFVEYVQGDHFTLKKNANYWQSGKPLLDGIEIKIFNDPQSMMTQLEAGALDLVLAPPIRDVARLSKDPRFAITFHRARRAKRHLTSELSGIAGVGPRTRQRLLSHFGSLANVREASIEQLEEVVTQRQAAVVWKHFKGG